MNTQNHARLCQVYNVYRLAAPVIMLCLFALPNFLLIMGLIVAVHIILANQVISSQVPCPHRNCKGRMQASNGRLSFWKVALTYTCDHCGKVQQVEIFNPRIEEQYSLP